MYALTLEEEGAAVHSDVPRTRPGLSPPLELASANSKGEEHTAVQRRRDSACVALHRELGNPPRTFRAGPLSESISCRTWKRSAAIAQRGLPDWSCSKPRQAPETSIREPQRVVSFLCMVSGIPALWRSSQSAGASFPPSARKAAPPQAWQEACTMKRV